MSVVALASLGLTLMNRLATWPPSKTQSTVSPPKTVAIFSSSGSKIRVDCSRPARIVGGVSASETVTERGRRSDAVHGCGALDAARVRGIQMHERLCAGCDLLDFLPQQAAIGDDRLVGAAQMFAPAILNRAY